MTLQQSVDLIIFKTFLTLAALFVPIWFYMLYQSYRLSIHKTFLKGSAIGLGCALYIVATLSIIERMYPT